MQPAAVTVQQQHQQPVTSVQLGVYKGAVSCEGIQMQVRGGMLQANPSSNEVCWAEVRSHVLCVVRAQLKPSSSCWLFCWLPAANLLTLLFCC
jgi:hypothetical protein